MFALALNIVAFAIGILAIRAWRRNGIEKEAIFSRLGISPTKLFRHSLQGLFAGAASLGIVFICMYAFGSLNVGSGEDSAVAYSLAKIFGMSFAEELAFRGFAFAGTLHFTKSKYCAVIIPSLIFGLAHAFVPNATFLSVLSTVLGGVMYAIPVLLTAKIWYSLGLHFAWNALQACVLGLPMSGVHYGSLQHFETNGNHWITGGSYGIEGGLAGIAARLVVIAITIAIWKLSLTQPSEIAR